MSITTTVSSTTRTPGTFAQLDVTSGSAGLVPIDNQVLLIGAYNGTGDSAMTQIFDVEQSDTLFAQGTEIALMVRAALAKYREAGRAAKLYAIGVASPSGGTAAIHTVTFANTATAGGTIYIRVAGRSYQIGVSIGDTVAVVALAAKAALDLDLANLPVTASVSAGVLSLTANCKGVNGNDITVIVDDVGQTGVTGTVALGGGATPAGAGVTTLTTALVTSLSLDFDSIAIANHASADVTALGTHFASAWAPAEKKWRFAMIAENGSVSTANALSSAADSEKFCVLNCEGMPDLPGNVAARTAAHVATFIPRDGEKPNANWDDSEIGSYAPSFANTFTSTELESALGGGTSPLMPNRARDGLRIVKLQTTKLTHNSAPVNLIDLSTMRGLVYVARQVDATLLTQFMGINKTEQVIKRIRSVVFQKLLELQDTGVCQNVEEYFSQLIVETDSLVPSRVVVSIPASIIPNLHQIVAKHVLYVE